MWKKTIALAAALTAIGFSVSALAQTVCTERQTFISKLGERHAENPRAIGLASNGTVLEILTSKQGSWTIIMTQPNGSACMVASGEYWEVLPIMSRDPAA